jgi:hypothetical protein
MVQSVACLLTALMMPADAVLKAFWSVHGAVWLLVCFWLLSGILLCMPLAVPLMPSGGACVMRYHIVLLALAELVYVLLFCLQSSSELYASYMYPQASVCAHLLISATLAGPAPVGCFAAAAGVAGTAAAAAGCVTRDAAGRFAAVCTV